MKTKKLIYAILTIVILLSQFSWLTFVMPITVTAVEANVAEKYFYDQLNDDEKTFYNIMDEMFFECNYEKLKKELQNPASDFGVNSVDITEKINKSESLKAKLENYTKGDQGLLNTMGTAKDAYMADHAGLFYIDPDYVTLRVKQKEGKLYAFLGTGRSETYINKAFWDYDQKQVKKEELIEALEAIKTGLNEAVSKVKEVKAQENQDLKEQQIKKAHDLVIEANSYKLEETIIEENKSIEVDSEKGDPWNVRTVYGAFGPKHEIVCEGFARAFKMILDELNIPCVLVYGAYVSSTKYEEHMWNYVQLNDKWYAVDTTWDNTDKIDPDKEVVGQESKEKISTEYFLAGEDKMSLNHLVTGIMSVANFEFKYPPLEASSDKYEITSDNAGLRIELDDESYDEEDQIKAGKFKISYFVDLNENGVEDPGERMGYKKAKEHGYYIVSSMMQYTIPNYDDYHDVPKNPAEEGWYSNGYFGYLDGNTYESFTDFYEDGTIVKDNDGVEGKDSYLSFYNSNCDYIQFGVTTDKPVEYYEGIELNMMDLIKMSTYTGTSTDMVALSDLIYNPSGTHTKPPYIKKATPIQNSTMIIGDTYHCVIEYDEKLVKIPNETLEASVVVENSSNTVANNFTLTDFEFDGEHTVSFNFKPSELYADDSVYYTISMLGLMGETSKKRPMAASYFCAHKCSAYAYKSQGIDWNVYGKPTLMDDVNLDDMTDEENADLAQLLKHRMTLVTTTTKPSEEKAMNDLLTEQKTGGEVVKSETYNIKLTLCKMQKIQNGQAVRVMLGFPEGYGPEDAGVTFKAYHYTKDASGNITGVEEIPCMVTELGLIIECSSFSPFTIAAIEGAKKEDTSRTVIFQTSEGGDVYNTYISEKNEGNVKSNKIVLDESNNEAKITIVPKEGYVVDDIVIGEKVIDVNGSDVQKVTTSQDSNQITYTIKYEDLKEQNYEAVVAKVAFIAKETKQAEKDAGFEVVAQPLLQPSFTMDSEITSEAKQAGPFTETDEFEVSYKITDMKSVGEQGIIGIGALLSYDKEKLQLKSITAGEDWVVKYNISDENTSAHNIAATYKLESEAISRTLAPEDGNEEQINKTVFKAKFMVLENEDVSEKITLSHIEGSRGKEEDSVIKANDVVTKVSIEKTNNPVEEKLETKPNATCKVEGNYVKNVRLKSTVEDMKKQLTSGTALPVNFFKHDGEKVVELSDTDIVGTGTIVRVGESEWTIIIKGDLDGNGELTVNDIVKFKLDYIGEEKLESAFLMAAEMDEVKTEDGSTSINDLVLMIIEYNNIKE